MIVRHPCSFMLICSFLQLNAFAQELEPRQLTNLPRGMYFAVAGYGYGAGSILMDQTIHIDDFKGELHTFFFSYATSLNLFGKSGKLDVLLPVGTGDWKYSYNDVEMKDAANGLGDMRIRFSVNFIGAPSLTPKAFEKYKPKTVMGYSLQVFVPIGQYNSEQLPNLGSNRWCFRNSLGISYTYDQWIFELYAAVWLFTNNHRYLGDNLMEQKPLIGIKAHCARTFKNGMWLALNTGYGYGGRITVNHEPKDVVTSAIRLGFTYSVPFTVNHSLKLTGVTGIRLQQGGDFDAVSLTYQYRWVERK
ncbi:transporter [Bacteroidota bacterium]